jgi:hypothetical protein
MKLRRMLKVVLACKPGPFMNLAIIQEKEDGKSNPKWTSIIWVSERRKTVLPKGGKTDEIRFAMKFR